MRRLMAALILVVFAVLATADALACPDGCQSAPTPAAADQCNAGGTCLFCAGALTATAQPIAIAPSLIVQSIEDPVMPAPPVHLNPPLDHPPRLA